MVKNYMMNKPKSLMIISIIVILFVIVGIYIIYIHRTDENSIDLNVFKNMASNATCSDVTNKLFVIDNQLVFWITEGNCPDASYSYTLFANTPNEILCKKYDSIAGPQEKYLDEKYKEFFQTITDNIHVDNFGLDESYKVTEVLF